MVKKVKQEKQNSVDKNYAVSVNNVTKYFSIPKVKADTLMDYLKNPFKHLGEKSKIRFTAVNNVSFKIEKGEFFGIIGNNGSGKSTLLKTIAGVYKPNNGNVVINGNMVPFLELGVGFNPELSGRDNIFLNAVILGMSKKEAWAQFDEIVKFSELERFLDTPLKNYSSGMVVRLAFSIAIKSKADIYLMDEVLAVGDSNFQSKCFLEFEDLRNAGKTFILVTHSMSMIRNFCDRVALMDHGNLIMIGDPDDVVDHYQAMNKGDV